MHLAGDAGSFQHWHEKPTRSMGTGTVPLQDTIHSMGTQNVEVPGIRNLVTLLHLSAGAPVTQYGHLLSAVHDL